jgi:hypothetical protein
MHHLFKRFSPAVLLAALLLAPVTALAAHPGDGKSEIENLKRRIEALEAEKAATTAEDAGPWSLGSLADKIELHGLVELEAVYNKPEGGDESSDLALATVELGLDIQATDYLSGHILLLCRSGRSRDPADLPPPPVGHHGRFHRW